MGHPHPNALTLLRAALTRHHLRGRTRCDAVGEEICRVGALLDGVKGGATPALPTDHPLVRHLPTALELAEQAAPELVSVLRPIAARLPWRYGYAARGDAPGLEAAMGWVEIVGPLAPFRSDAVCLGLTLIGPDTHYLSHRHPAVELYQVVGGTAAWTAGEGTVRQPPGAYVLHPAGIAHAMRTGAEPLLAIYSWTGDVHSPSVWVDEERAE